MIYVLSAIIIGLLALLVINKNQHGKEIDHLLNYQADVYEGWAKERQQLLDRIQAPSYDHLKHHEVKIIKAQNNEKEPPKLEVL